MRLPFISLCVVALLCSCDGSDPVADQANNTAALPPPPTVNASDPSGAPPPSNSEKPPVTASGNLTATPAAAIPTVLHGRWGLTPADCTSTRGDNKGLLVISADKLTFYESRAVPKTNVQTSPNSFSADFEFTGEGQTWTRFQTLELQNGSKLVRTESGPMASYTYAKCR